jgi:hypothetical protein
MTAATFDRTAYVRNLIAHEAATSVDALLRMIQREAGKDGFDLVLEQVLIRALELNSVVISVLDDDDALDTHGLNNRVHGESTDRGNA